LSVVVFNGGRAPYASELAAGEQIAYLLTVTFAGREFRWSYPGAHHIEKTDGTVLSFHGMDAPDMVQSMDFESSSPADLSVSFDGLVFPGDIDLPLLIAQGHRLERAKGELAAIVDDGEHNWEDRLIILVGQLSDPVYGDPVLHANAVGFTLEAPAYNDTALFPSSDQVIASSDFPAEYQGFVRPWVFGQPGNYLFPGPSGGPVTVTKGTPLIPITIISSDFWLAAGHLVAPDTYGAILGDLVIYDATDGTDIPCTVEEYDYISPFLGPEYNDQTFTALAAAGTNWDPTHEYWLRGWTSTTASEPTWGGYPNADWTGPMTSAGEILEYVLSKSSLSIDKARCATATALLQGFKLGGYIAEQVTPYEWIVDNLLPILPVALASGPKGLYPIVWQFDATAKDAREKVTEGAHFRRVTGVVTDDSSIINEFSVNYVSDGGTFLRRLVVSGAIEETDNDSTGVVFSSSTTTFFRPNLFARRSYLDHDNVIYADSVDTEHIWDDAVAGLVAGWKIRAHAFARKTITYESSFRYAWLEPGDVILLTDSGLYLDEQVVIIQAKTWDVTGLRFDLLLIQDPPRDLRPL
jgi:hypothetical protein